MDRALLRLQAIFSCGGHSMLLEPSAKAVEGPLCGDVVVECCGSVASHF